MVFKTMLQSGMYLIKFIQSNIINIKTLRSR